MRVGQSMALSAAARKRAYLSAQGARVAHQNKGQKMSTCPVSQIDPAVFAPDVFAEGGVNKVLEELRDQLVGNDIRVIDIQARLSRSNDGMMVLITVSTPSHQRTLTAFDHFVTQAFRRGRAKDMNVLVFWRYRLPQRAAVQ